MQEKIINVFKNFRDTIYNFFSFRRDATFELVDSLSSNMSANSIVELSLNPVHRRNYCSITRALDEFYPLNADKKEKNNELTKILVAQCEPLQERQYHLLGVDCTPNPRVFSPTQEDRGAVYSPNAVFGNKPITIGHQYSIVAYLPEKAGDYPPPWVMPLSCHRVGTNEKGPIIGMQQINFCIQSQDAFKNKLCVSVADSAYSSPACLLEAFKNPNQVHISRVRSNRVFYFPFVEESTVKKSAVKIRTSKKGRKKRFGKRFQLSDKTTWGEPNDIKIFTIITAKGKTFRVEIKCWNTMIMRGTHESNVAEYSFRLVQICVYQESGKVLFKKPLWLMVAGEKRFELSLHDIFYSYRQRFDLEHFFRFGKNRLLMDKSQTPDVNHEEAWWQLTMIAYAQLFLAREIAKNNPRPWEKYLPVFKSDRKISPTQVQKDFGHIIRTFGTPAKPPKHPKKAPGRQQGDTQTKRIHHPVIIKKKIAHPDAIQT